MPFVGRLVGRSYPLLQELKTSAKYSGKNAKNPKIKPESMPPQKHHKRGELIIGNLVWGVENSGRKFPPIFFCKIINAIANPIGTLTVLESTTNQPHRMPHNSRLTIGQGNTIWNV